MQSCDGALPPMSSHTLSLFVLLATALVGGTAHYRARLSEPLIPSSATVSKPRPSTTAPASAPAPRKHRKPNKKSQTIEVEVAPIDDDSPTREAETNLESRANVWAWRGTGAGEAYDVVPDELDRHLAARSSQKASERGESGTRRGGASATPAEKQTGATMSSGTGRRGNAGRVWHDSPP